MQKKLEEGDNVLCTVKRIVGTTVFVDIEDNGEGTIVISEISPGRIRNLRNYVVPGKKIVCEILSIDKNIHLSLRRVGEKERKEVMEKFQLEKNSFSILKSVIGEEADKVRKKIKEKSGKKLYDFFQLAKEKPELLGEYIDKNKVKRLVEILKKRKDKKVEIKKEFNLKSENKEGVNEIKEVLSPYKNEIIYLSAGRFVIKISGQNYKEANKKADKILQEIEEKSEKKSIEFNIKEK